MQDATRVRIDLEMLPKFKGIVTKQAISVTYAVEPDWQLYEFKNVPIDIDNRLLTLDPKNQRPFRVEPERVPVVKLDVKGDLADRLNTIKTNPQELMAFQRKHLRLVVYPTPTDLTRKEAWPVKPEIEFVLFEDIPTPRKGIDFRVRVEFVNIILK